MIAAEDLLPRPLAALAWLACIAGAACGAPTDASRARAVVSVTPSSTTLRVGERIALHLAVVSGAGDTLRTPVRWSSSDTAVARVDTTGRVVGMAAGDATITASTDAGSVSASLGVRGLPFGPFHLPASLFGQSLPTGFTGVLRAPTPDSVLAMLDSARSRHLRIVLRLVRGRQRFQNADSSFSLALWKVEVDRFRGIDFAPYVRDGTVIGHSLMDEPEDPTNWGGRGIAYPVLDSAAEYSKELWPEMPAGVYSPPSLIEGGAPYRFVDFAFAQYTVEKGDIDAWLRNEVSLARRMGIGLQLSLNVLVGGTNGAAMTPQQLERYGATLASEPYACALLMWKYDVHDPSYFEDPDVLAAADSVGRVAATNPGRGCGR
ncbi:MAG TPA: Ig-like domain-containing protein [Gemmatimonadaceae bacterium]|nr:Ig-like domain-containing protein [Gemmatimonadaceae bacterium]